MADTITTWEIDPAHTTISFKTTHMMFTTVRGRFTRFSGTVHVNQEHPDQSRVEVDIDTASIDTGVTDRDNHLRSADFLDVEHHPKMLFRTTRVEGAHVKSGDRFQVQGTLTVRGQTRPIVLQAIFQGTGKDPWGKLRAGFSAHTEIDRRDWGLVWNQALDAGGMLVGNTITIELEVQAVRQGDPSDRLPVERETAGSRPV